MVPETRKRLFINCHKMKEIEEYPGPLKRHEQVLKKIMSATVSFIKINAINELKQKESKLMK